MKTIVSTSILLICFTQVFCQSIFNQAGLSASNLDYNFSVAPSTYTTTIYSDIFTSYGDSLLNGKTYQKIYMRRRKYVKIIRNSKKFETTTITCDKFNCLVYQTDDKNVYKYNSQLNTDVLLYEFGLSVGDTLSTQSVLHYDPFNYNYRLIVESVDTLYYLGVPRRKLNLKYTTTDSQQFSLIEGIGSTRGVFGGFLQFLPSIPQPYRLGCLTSANFDDVFYSQSECFNFDCSEELTDDTTQTELDDFFDFNLYPTQSKDGKFNIHFSSNKLLKYSYRIYDSSGRLIDRNARLINENVLNISGLANGLYFISVDFMETVKTFKVLLYQN